MIDHEAVERPENIWAVYEGGATYHRWFIEWWACTYYRRAHDLGVRPGKHMRHFQRILGRQTTTVVFVCRNWVWDRPDEGWTLYVDRRGPAFGVRRGMTGAEAWEAFRKFKARVERWTHEVQVPDAPT